MITHDQILPSIYHLQRRGEVGTITICALNSPPLARWPTNRRSPRRFPASRSRRIRRWTSRRTRDVSGAVQGRDRRDAAAEHGGGGRARPFPRPGDPLRPGARPARPDRQAAGAEARIRRSRSSGWPWAAGSSSASSTTSGSTAVRSKPGGSTAPAGSASFAAARPAGRALLLPPLEFPELVHQGEHRSVHVHRLPLRRSGLLHHRAEAGRGVGPRRRGPISQRQRRLPLVDRPRRLGERRGARACSTAWAIPTKAPARTTRASASTAKATTAARSSSTTTSSAACSYGYVDNAAGAAFRYINPDYFRLVPWQGDGLKPVGYGYDSIEANVQSALAGQRRGRQLGREARGPSANRPPRDRRHAGQQLDQRTSDRSRATVDPARRRPGRDRLRRHAGRAIAIEDPRKNNRDNWVARP